VFLALVYSMLLECANEKGRKGDSTGRAGGLGWSLDHLGADFHSRTRDGERLRYQVKIAPSKSECFTAAKTQSQKHEPEDTEAVVFGGTEESSRLLNTESLWLSSLQLDRSRMITGVCRD
jgi:hypothetical protein